MSASAASSGARMGHRKTEKPIPVGLKSIKTVAAVPCCEIHALSGLRCAGFEHHPWSMRLMWAALYRRYSEVILFVILPFWDGLKLMYGL